MNKVGIMGGTFNPIHFGHLFLAENAYEQVGLDQIIFMPSKNPPHKAKPELITEQQRVDMISLAIKDNPHFTLSTMELERDGYTYTADTLSILKKENPNMEYYFLIGADSLFMLPKWKDPQIILGLCTIVAASRDHVDYEKLEEQARYLRNTFGASIIIIKMPTIQISSANIRDRVANKETIRYYVPQAVNEYIEANQLYQEP